MFPTFLFLCLAGSIIGLQSRKPDSADRGITASWDWRRKGGGGGGGEGGEGGEGGGGEGKHRNFLAEFVIFLATKKKSKTRTKS